MKRLLLTFFALSLGFAHAAREKYLDVVDVLLAFDISAVHELAEAGYANCADYAALKVAEMNECLTNSGLADDFTFRLVGATTLAFDTSSLPLQEILKGVQEGLQDYLPLLSARDAAGADLVSVITGGEKVDGANGLGYTLTPGEFVSDYWISAMSDYGFNACRLRALLQPGDCSLIHEFGHNMGCGHAEGIDDPSQSLQYAPYSMGARFEGKTQSWVTVMGYPDGDHAWAPCFSSPTASYDGALTGSVDHDNVRTLRESHSIVARYRTAIKPPDGIELFEPKSAVIWQGAVFDDDQPVAIVQAKVGKPSGEKSKVSLTVMDMSGKKFSSAAVKVSTGPAQDWKFAIKNYGSMTLRFGANGFTGMTSAGAIVRSVPSQPLEGFARFEFIADSSFVVSGLQVRYFPDETIGWTDRKWTVLAKPGKLKAVKPNPKKGVAGGIVENGVGNFSGLKISFDAKRMTFKGSFKFWTYDEAKNKLKSLSANFTGIVVDGEGSGVAVVKKIPVGTITVKKKETSDK